MSYKLILLSGLFFLWSGLAQAQTPTSCLPPFTSGQFLQVMSLDEKASFTYSLTSANFRGIYPVPVNVDVTYDPLDDKSLDLSFRFADEFEGVSLPYTVYAILVVQNGDVVGWQDLTQGCSSPGASFFPGQGVKMRAAKLHGTSMHQIQIMVWGRL